jgi:hypothetical protein
LGGGGREYWVGNGRVGAEEVLVGLKVVGCSIVVVEY